MENKMKISISESTYKRLEQKAIGFDTPEQVIIRLLDQSDGFSSSKPELYFAPNEDEFKRDFLNSGISEIALYYKSGKREIVHWKAKKFTKDSNLRANLWSGYLRNWSDKGIIKAELVALPKGTNSPNDDTRKTISLAEILGLKYYEEMQVLDDLYDIHADNNNDNYPVGYYIEFSDEAPEDILNKISGLHNLTVYLPNHPFE